MTNLLQNNVALVTGGGSKLGRRVALMLANEGASLVINDSQSHSEVDESSASRADVVVDDVRLQGGNAFACYDDMSRFGDGSNVINKAIDAFGRLDILVNCPTAQHKSAPLTTDPGNFHHVIQTNVKGTFVAIRHASVIFRKQRSGRIVNFTSDAGLGECLDASHAAASEAIVGMTRTIARDLGKYGVTCNAVSQSHTTHFSDSHPQQIDEDAGEKSPGNLMNLENAAALAIVLCTNVIPNVNGQVFGTEGGDIYLYSTPSTKRSAHSWGAFTLDDLDDVMPSIIKD